MLWSLQFRLWFRIFEALVLGFLADRAKGDSDFADVVENAGEQGDHGNDKDRGSGEGGGLPVKAKAEQQAGNQGSDERDQAQQEGSADHLGALFHRFDLRGAGFGFRRMAVLHGLVPRADILPQPADDTHETHIDREDEESRGGKEDGGRHESLEQSADVIHGSFSPTA